MGYEEWEKLNREKLTLEFATLKGEIDTYTDYHSWTRRVWSAAQLPI